MRQLAYTGILLIIRLHYLWVKENLLNCREVSKYYEYDCKQNFTLYFMSLLAALIIKNNLILAGIYFNFLKKIPRLN